MAGRPKMMAKRMGELTERVLELQNELLDLIPEQYQGAQTEAKPTALGAAWRSVDDTMEYLSMYLLDLDDLLRERAGIAPSYTIEELESCCAAMEACTPDDKTDSEAAEPEHGKPGADEELGPGELEPDAAGAC